MIDSVDIVIVSYNTRADVDACLASVFQTGSAHLGRVFVVDNASTDGTPALVRERWPDVTLIALDRNLGFGAANNVAIRRATGDLVLLLNSDARLTTGALNALVGRLRASGSVAAGPCLLDDRGRPEVSFGPMLTPWREFAQSLRVKLAASPTSAGRWYAGRRVRHERVVDWVSGACLLVDRQAAMGAGLFDERFFMYEEDVDFCAALRAAGGRILFTPAATVTHLRGRSVRASGGGHGHYDRSHVAFYRKHAPHWAPVLEAWLRVRGRSIR